MNEARTKAVSKLYERIASGEQLTDKEYEFIDNYEIQCLLEDKMKANANKPSSIDTVFKYGKKAVDMIDKVFPNNNNS